ncbi:MULTISPECIES: nucleotide pyrophosphohydrolase [Peribacillus]|uniref:nucleotide pyrophosphohydrolase n=1 Tax=Peribacillus TaxID=2675229 RepID=UPI0011DCC900|nr:MULTISPECIES: nucleotide pyrophosphohydrolase [Peribacillus]MDQ0884890.1 NTP pyrophosphatase (non-canonical NTP hydrolase) [Peribacillus sp. V2I11]
MKQLQNKVIKFRDERGWQKYHTPKDLAISLSIEASELLENFQWKSDQEAIVKNMENIKDEMADVFIYLLMLSKELNVDLEKAVETKLQKNAGKYPIEKAYGSNKKYNEL